MAIGVRVTVLLVTIFMNHCLATGYVTVETFSELTNKLLQNITDLKVSVTKQELLTADELKNFPLLETLSIEHGTIKRFHKETFRNLTSLTYLSLFNNSIDNLPFNGFPPSLITLDIGYNKLTLIRRHIFNGLDNLTTLKLHRNSINTIQIGALDVCKKLTNLEIQHNQFQNFPLNLKLPELKRLDISGNSISEIKSNMFDGMPKLDSFIIARNKIETLTDNLAPLLKRLGSLTLSYNPIHCNCFTAWVLNPLIKRKVRTASCRTPTPTPMMNPNTHTCTVPKITSRNDTIFATVGDDITLNCTADGEPSPNITISNRNNVVKFVPRPPSVTNRVNSGVVQFKASVNTTYTCVAENVEGSVKVSRKVEVQEPKQESTLSPTDPMKSTTNPPSPTPEATTREILEPTQVLMKSTKEPQFSTPEALKSKTQESGDNSLGLGIGVGVGAVILIAVAVIAIFLIKRKMRKVQPQVSDGQCNDGKPNTL